MSRRPAGRRANRQLGWSLRSTASSVSCGGVFTESAGRQAGSAGKFFFATKQNPSKNIAPAALHSEAALPSAPGRSLASPLNTIFHLARRSINPSSQLGERTSQFSFPPQRYDGRA